MILEIIDIKKSFSGKEILKGINFKIVGGRAMGFLGRNGAGKTTTIRALMDIFKADSGKFLLDGKNLNISQNRVGYLPEERGLYSKVSLNDQLSYFGKLKGMSSKEIKTSIDYWLERMELKEFANKNAETLSKGNQQKVQIIQAIINEPDILIFDEPFSGLDPVNSKILKDLIREFIEKGKIVIFSSHQMSYVEDICDDVTFIKNGNIELTGSLDILKSDLGKNKYVVSSSDDEKLFDLLSKIESIKEIKKNKNEFIIETDGGINSNDILSNLIKDGIIFKKFEYYRPTLEDIFLEINKEQYNE